jgi:hypothetical protein
LPQLEFKLGFSLWHIAEKVSKLPMFADLFLCTLSQFDNIAFLWTEFWQIAKNGAQLATVEKKLKILHWSVAEIYLLWT